ncbi:hypothetical protein K2173_028427 [Erythroxylum novogranatense]|uniref:Cytochrome P450 n=1 Tax=Erythroxylum novogranatense TaxID=1862640 RepID=A0AAV8U5K4_9ROSI|nr:hypothetical protein K2173_028427 [Erythroxylum novogranatense]
MEASLSYYFLLFLLLFFLTKRVFQKTRNLPPGPGLSLPIIGHLYLFKKPLHRTFATLSNKYGPILYLQFGSRPVVLVSSPVFVEECFTKNDVIFANRPRLLAGEYLGYGYTTLVWASYGQHWRNLRRIASSEILSSNRLQMFHYIRVDEVRSLLRRLFRGSVNGEFMTVSMKSMFFELTLNVMMRMIAGKSYYGENSVEMDEQKRFKEILRETFLLSGATNIVDFVPLLKWIGPNKLAKRLEILQRKRDGLMQELIDERRMKNKGNSESEQASKTMIDVLLALKETDPEYFTDEIIRGMMQVMLSAGTDTSAATMEWTLSVLLNNPEALLKAQKQIDTQVGQSKLIEESDLPKLPYLDAILKETLRMYPVAPLLVPHESSEECTIGGFRVPRGTMLLVNLWAIHNDPNLWEDPIKFKPERFLDEEGKGYGFNLLPFGAGRRGCPGEGMATRVIGLALGSLIQCFEWKVANDQPVDMAEGSGLTMPKVNPLLAKCRPRTSMLSLLSQI